MKKQFYANLIFQLHLKIKEARILPKNIFPQLKMQKWVIIEIESPKGLLHEVTCYETKRFQTMIQRISYCRNANFLNRRSLNRRKISKPKFFEIKDFET